MTKDSWFDEFHFVERAARRRRAEALGAPVEQDIVKVMLPVGVDPRDLQTSEALWRRIEKAAAKAVFKQAGMAGLAKAYTVQVLRFVESGPGTVLAMRTIKDGKLSRYVL